MRTVDFVEDDYGNIEIVPAENGAWCAEEQRKIEAFSEEHRDGIGWSDVYVRHPVPVPLASRGLRLAEAREALARHLEPFDQITYEHRTVCDPAKTVAYGSDPQVVVFAELDGEQVRELWATLQPSDASQVDAAVAGLGELARWNLVLVDWGWRCVISLTDAARLREYLARRMEVFTRPPEQVVRTRSRWLERLRAWFGG